MRRLAPIAAWIVAALAATAVPADPPAPLAVGAAVPADVRVAPVAAPEKEEAAVTSLGGDAARPLVILFWSAKCPVCRRYEPAVKALAKDYESRVRLVVVFPNDGETAADARRWFDAANLACVAATDPRQEASARLGAFVTPTAVVVDAAGALRYRGPIDDDRRARRRDTVDHLRAALESVLAGKPVENPEPRAFGSSVRVRASSPR